MSDLARILARTDRTNGHWLWTGATIWSLVRNFNPLERALILAGGAAGAFGMWLAALAWYGLFCR
jgi:hypothetical protein